MRKKIFAAALLLGASLMSVGGAKADVCAHIYFNGSIQEPCVTTEFVNLHATLIHKAFYDGVAVSPSYDANWTAVAIRYGVPLNTSPPFTGTGGVGIGVWVAGTPFCVTVPNLGSPGGLITTNGTCPGYPRF